MDQINNKSEFIVGVPCSRLKDFIIKAEQDENTTHITATDEGEAIGLAVGYYLATGLEPLVYMQSDGFSNAINALTTLVIPYNIPVNLFISIREDGPQHIIMGENIKKIIKMFNYEQRTNYLQLTK